MVSSQIFFVQLSLRVPAPTVSRREGCHTGGGTTLSLKNDYAFKTVQNSFSAFGRVLYSPPPLNKHQCLLQKFRFFCWNLVLILQSL